MKNTTAIAVALAAMGLQPVLADEDEKTIQFKSARSQAAEVFWVNDKGSEQSLGTIDPGKTLEFSAFEGNIWRFRQAGKLIGEYVTDAEPSQSHVIPAKLRSHNSKTKVGLRAVNRTGRPVEVFWLDYKGNEKSYGTIAPNKAWGISTYATHPWRFKINGKPVGVYVTDGTGKQQISLCSGLNQHHPGLRSKRFTADRDVEYLCWLRTDQPRSRARRESASEPWDKGFVGKTLDVDTDGRRGYNLLYMNPRDLLNKGLPAASPVVMARMSPSSHKYHIERGIRIPHEFHYTPVLSTREQKSREMYFSESERQKGFSVNVGLKGGVDAGAKGGASTGVNFGYSENRKDMDAASFTSISATRTAAKFWLTARKELIRPGTDLVDYVRGMGTGYKDFKRFFERFGTHYPLSTLFGGMATYEQLIESSKVETAISKSFSGSVSQSAKAKGATMERNVGFNTTNANRDSSGWESETSQTIIRGGNLGGSYDMWSLGEDDTLVPIKTDLRPIYDLVWPETFGAVEPAEIAVIRTKRRQMKAAYAEYLKRESRRRESINARPRVFAMRVDSIKLSKEDDDGAGGPDLWGYVRLVGERGAKSYGAGAASIRIPNTLPVNKTVYAWKNYGKDLRDTLDNKDTISIDNGSFPKVSRTEALFTIMPKMKQKRVNGVTRYVPDYELAKAKVYPDTYLRDDDAGGENADDWFSFTHANVKMTLADVVKAGGRKSYTVSRTTSGLGKVTIRFTVREVGLELPYKQVKLPAFPNFDAAASN